MSNLLFFLTSNDLNNSVFGSIMIWSLLNIFVAIGAVMVGFTIAFKLIKYLNLKNKLMQ